MNILLTNDDGIYAEGLYVLYKEIKKISKVTVVAPESEMSSVGHGITISRPILYKKIYRRDKFFGYGISGTPADCVNIGINTILNGKPDLIVSGINKGENLADDINYSGTVAAAVEGTLMGIPSFAISLASGKYFKFKPAADFALKLARLVIQKGLPHRTLLNVNVPDTQGKEINAYKITLQGRNTQCNTIEEKNDPRGVKYYWIGRKDEGFESDEESDLAVIKQGLVSITPLQIDRTHHSVVKELQQWNL